MSDSSIRLLYNKKLLDTPEDEDIEIEWLNLTRILNKQPNINETGKLVYWIGMEKLLNVLRTREKKKGGGELRTCALAKQEVREHNRKSWSNFETNLTWPNPMVNKILNLITR